MFYGLFLTLSSWVLFYTATRKSFFENNIGMFSLQENVSGAKARRLLSWSNGCAGPGLDPLCCAGTTAM